MTEKGCAFEAASFVRVDSTELATNEPPGAEDEHFHPIGDHDRTKAALPARAGDDRDLPVLAAVEPEVVAGKSDDRAIVARSRGGIKRRRYELRVSYYLSFCFNCGFLLRFLRGLLGNNGRDWDERVPEQAILPGDEERSGRPAASRR